MTDILSLLRDALADSYAIERELGRGGMATVYLARDLKHDRQVAIKVLDPDLASTVGPDRFLREIKLVASLQHPHILTIYDSGDARGLLYFVMPFIEGESLRDKLNREKELSIEDAVQIAREVSDGLAFAHSRGIVHRDIKPENILLSGGHAIVADFGIARAVSEAGEKLTQTGMAIGTPAYMSPEQAVGESAIDGRSDVYSLACVLYEMLSGRPPFVGPSARAIMAQHSMEIVPSLQILRQSIPDELEDAVLRALEKVPADRFPTAAQFAKALSPSEITISNSRLSRRITRSGHVVRRPIHSRWRRYVWVAAGAGAALAVIGWMVGSRLTGKAAAADDSTFRSIAVLYFDDLSKGDSLRHVADGFTDALIHDLSSISALKVISRNGVLPYKGKEVPPDSIARALSVGTLVDGTVQESGDNIKVTVSLINAKSGEEISSKAFERPRADMLALQDDIAGEVSIFLRQRVGQEIQLNQSRGETQKVTAWEMFQRAQEMEDDVQPLLAANDTVAAAAKYREADSTLARTQELDKNWIRPIVRRGWIAYSQTRTPGFNRDSIPLWLARAGDFANQALAIQPTDPDALELRGTIRYFSWLLNLEPDAAKADVLHAGAQKDLEDAVAANPNQAGAWGTLSHLRMAASENALGKLAARKAYEADPFMTAADRIIWRLFQSSLDLEDRNESEHWCAEGVRRFPANPRFAECRLWLATMPGAHPNIAATWRILAEFDSLTPVLQRDLANHKGRMLVAMALARSGQADSARRVAEAARVGADIDQTRDLSMIEAIVRTTLGDKNEAIRLLSVYLAANPQMRRSLATDDSWYFRDLRTDARYKAMTEGGN
ncbi:MAG: protein kinase [Gemmatimonadota bacterium]